MADEQETRQMKVEDLDVDITHAVELGLGSEIRQARVRRDQKDDDTK